MQLDLQKSRDSNVREAIGNIIIGMSPLINILSPAFLVIKLVLIAIEYHKVKKMSQQVAVTTICESTNQVKRESTKSDHSKDPEVDISTSKARIRPNLLDRSNVDFGSSIDLTISHIK